MPYVPYQEISGGRRSVFAGCQLISLINPHPHPLLRPAPRPLYVCSAHNIQQFLSLLLDSVILRLSLYTSSCTNIRSIIYARRLRPSFQDPLAHAHFRDSDPFTRIPSPLTRALTSVHFPKLPARLNSYSSLSTPYIITDALSQTSFSN